MLKYKKNELSCKIQRIVSRKVYNVNLFQYKNIRYTFYMHQVYGRFLNS